MPVTVAIAVVDPLCNLPEPLGERLVQVQMKTELPVVKLETITLKKFSVIGQVVGHSDRLWDEPMNQASPVGVTFSEIDGSGHGIVSIFPEPLLCSVKQ